MEEAELLLLWREQGWERGGDQDTDFRHSRCDMPRGPPRGGGHRMCEPEGHGEAGCGEADVGAVSLRMVP